MPPVTALIPFAVGANVAVNAVTPTIAFLEDSSKLANHLEKLLTPSVTSSITGRSESPQTAADCIKLSLAPFNLASVVS